MISSYATIDKLFGAPLSTVPVPNVPFKLKGWHIAAGIAVGAFAAYGMYCASKDVRKIYARMVLKQGEKK